MEEMQLHVFTMDMACTLGVQFFCEKCSHECNFTDTGTYYMMFTSEMIIQMDPLTLYIYVLCV